MRKVYGTLVLSRLVFLLEALLLSLFTLLGSGLDRFARADFEDSALVEVVDLCVSYSPRVVADQQRS